MPRSGQSTGFMGAMASWELCHCGIIPRGASRAFCGLLTAYQNLDARLRNDSRSIP